MCSGRYKKCEGDAPGGFPQGPGDRYSGNGLWNMDIDLQNGLWDNRLCDSGHFPNENTLSNLGSMTILPAVSIKPHLLPDLTAASPSENGSASSY